MQVAHDHSINNSFDSWKPQVLCKEIQKYAAHHRIVAMASFKLVNRFSVFAHRLSIKHLVKTKFAQFWTNVVTPGVMQHGKQHHGLSVEMQAMENHTFQACHQR